jgi:hypothetical protein
VLGLNPIPSGIVKTESKEGRIFNYWTKGLEGVFNPMGNSKEIKKDLKSIT